MNPWALCVLLHLGGEVVCISTFPLESLCWVEGANWLERANAWRARSNLELPISYECRYQPDTRTPK